jgi:outer membrane protein assembly factor BamB
MHSSLPPHRQHLMHTLYRYMYALEHGDSEIIAAVLHEAEYDRDLERMIFEVNDMYQADDILVQPAEKAQALDLLAAFTQEIGAGEQNRPARPPSRVMRVGALIQTLAAVLIVGLLIGGYLVLSMTHHFTPGSQNPVLPPAEPMVAVTTQNAVYALNPESGNVLWDYVSPDTSNMTSVVTLQNRMAYFATQDGQVYALHETDGSLLWHTDLHMAHPVDYNNLNIVYDDGVVYAGLADQNNGYVIYAIQASNGRVLWQSQKNSQLLAASGGLVYIAGGTDAQGDPELESLQGQNGQHVWSYDTPPMSAIVDNNVLYVYSEHRQIPSDFGGNKQYKPLAAFDAQHGKLLWTREVINDSVDPIVLADHVILLGSLYDVNAYHLCAYRTSNGSQAWCVPSKYAPFTGNAASFNNNITSYAAGNGLLYASYSVPVSPGSNTTFVEMEAFNINNGSLVWSKRFANTGDPGLMTVLNGTIYTTIDNTIYALSGKDGSQLWNTRVSLNPPGELVASS